MKLRVKMSPGPHGPVIFLVDETGAALPNQIEAKFECGGEGILVLTVAFGVHGEIEMEEAS